MVVTDDLRSPTVRDEDLVELACRGEERALDELVARHHEVVYRVVLRILDDPDRAADASQETFLKAFRALSSFRGEARFRTWLLSIAANEARGALRRSGCRHERPLQVADPIAQPGTDPSDGVAALEELERVRQLLTVLPEKQRLAVQLRTQEGLSFREVGEIIGSSEGAARVNYHHGIRKLREMLK